MTITAKVIADSISEAGKRITTFQLRYPRFIHAELMTHRMFSRNASSSRAIPVERLIKDIIDDTAMPLHWGKNQPGMQAKEEHNDKVVLGYPCDKLSAWLMARDAAIEVAQAFNKAGYHKQIVNRLLEPFSHINVLVTATEYQNFFALRDHPDAQPEIMVLAQEMKKAMEVSTPELLMEGAWHVPYIDQETWELIWDEATGGGGAGPREVEWMQEISLKVSVARCARVSYLTQEGTKPTIEQDLKLYDRLLSSVPLHASPAEHQATPDTQFLCRVTHDDGWVESQTRWKRPEYHGNLVGWTQFRKTLTGENQG